jgi:hypothetical protein
VYRRNRGSSSLPISPRLSLPRSFISRPIAILEKTNSKASHFGPSAIKRPFVGNAGIRRGSENSLIIENSRPQIPGGLTFAQFTHRRAKSVYSKMTFRS